MKPVSEETKSVPPLWEGWGRPTKPSEALDMAAKYAKMEGLWCSDSLFEIKGWEDNNEHKSWEPEFVKPKDYGTKNRKCACEYCSNLREYRKKVESEGLTCDNIRACAVGILIMATLDGPAVNAYFFKPKLDALIATIDFKSLGMSKFSKNFDFIEDLLVYDKVGGPACLFLHAGMVRLIRERIQLGDEFKALSSVKAAAALPEDPVKMIEYFLAGPVGPRGGKMETRRQRAEWRKNVLDDHKSKVIGWNDNDSDDEFDDESDVYELGIPLTKGEKRHEAIYKSFLYAVEYAKQYEGRMGFDADAEPVKV